MTSQLKILHVEDDEEYSRFLDIKLNKIAKRNKKGKLIFDLAKSPSEGLSKAMKNNYDCVICDYQLIGGTGLDFLFEVRSRAMELPIIFITGQGDEEVAREAFVHGVNDYFTKNIGLASYDRIYNAIKTHVNHHLTDTEKKNVEKKLIFSENKYHTIFSNANDAIILMNKDGLTDCNKKFEALLGYTKDEILGKMPYDLSPPKQQDGSDSMELAQRYMNMAYEGGLERFNWTLESKGGNLLFFEIDLNPIYLAEEKMLMAIMHDITQRLEIERELRESNEMSSILFNSPFNYANLLIDLDGTILVANDSAKKVFADFEPLAGNRLQDIIEHPLTGPAHDILEKVLSERKEIRLNRSYGQKDYSVIVQPLLNDEGDVWRIALFINDISEYVNKEKALSSALRMSYEIVHSLPFGLYILKYESPDKLFVLEANKTAQMYSGIDADSHIGKEFSEIWTSWGSQKLKKEILRAFKKNICYSNDSFFYETEGEKIYFMVNAFRLPDDKVCLSEFEITGIKETELELQRNKINLEKLISTLNDINSLNINIVLERIAENIKFMIPYDSLSFYSVDYDNKILRPIYARGLDKEYVMKYEASIYEGATGRVARGGDAEIINDPFSDKDVVLIPGSSKTEEKMMSIPLKGHGGTIGVLNLFRVGSNFEMSELKKLKIFAAQSSVALENALLFDNLKNAKEITDFFVSMLAHDLRNSMSIMKGYMDLLLTVPEQTSDIVSKLQYQSERMKHIIDNALLFARLEEGEISGHYEIRGLRSILDESVDNFKYHPHHEKIGVEHLAEECPVMSLPILVNVFNNLIDNALKYASRCSISYTISDENYTINFIDDGNNTLSPGELDNLMNRHTRGNKNQTYGHGLGLFIVKRILDLHKGKICVSSDGGGGTRFTVSLPMLDK